MSTLPSELEDLQLRLRDLHFTTFNGLNTTFTGGLIANLLGWPGPHAGAAALPAAHLGRPAVPD